MLPIDIRQYGCILHIEERNKTERKQDRQKHQNESNSHPGEGIRPQGANGGELPNSTKEVSDKLVALTMA